ncbi:hypothetical protein CLM82_01190, partial [Streptomyces albidoflavus]
GPGVGWVFTAPRGGRGTRGGCWYEETWRRVVHGRAPRGVTRGAKARAGLRPVLGVEGLTPHGRRHSQKVWLDEGGHPRVAVEARRGDGLQGVGGTYAAGTVPAERKVALALEAPGAGFPGVVDGIVTGRGMILVLRVLTESPRPGSFQVVRFGGLDQSPATGVPGAVHLLYSDRPARSCR